jgi:hypothetical protein
LEPAKRIIIGVCKQSPFSALLQTRQATLKSQQVCCININTSKTCGVNPHEQGTPLPNKFSVLRLR